MPNIMRLLKKYLFIIFSLIYCRVTLIPLVKQGEIFLLSNANYDSTLGPVCERFPCKNSGQCFEEITGDFTCHCAPGFAGNYFCLEIII